METTLAVNPGSSSRKYALYCDGRLALEIHFEDTDNGYQMSSQESGSQQIFESISKDDFADSFKKMADLVDKYLFKIAAGTLQIIAIRVVAPGTFFQKHQGVTGDYLAELKKCETSAPIHIPAILREVTAAGTYFKQAKIIATSDSFFHSEMPDKAREYSIAAEDTQAHDMYKFGYHGLSVASVVRRIHAVIGQDPDRMIVCHVGNGVSVTAVKKGKSVDTTMGFSPTSGLLMGSRAGDIDATALLELMRVKHWRPKDAELYINTRCGLTGIAGESDIRRLLDRRSKNDVAATKAIAQFAYSIQKAIAAQTVALGGVDVLVLTATAVTRSAELRSFILTGLEYLGVKVSADRNDLLVGKDGVISVRNSAVKVVVMKTDEMGEMAQIAHHINLATTE
jgi:acetate kinase